MDHEASPAAHKHHHLRRTCGCAAVSSASDTRARAAGRRTSCSALRLPLNWTGRAACSAKCGGPPRTHASAGDGYGIGAAGRRVYGDSGGASRFFPVFRYEAKAASAERPRGEDGTAHPTVKPVDLMAWLVRLVTPPGGLVLDPFAGSGTTAEACIVEGFRCVLIEKDPAYAELIRTRLRKPIQPAMFGGAA